jgi:hypothetical protein
LRLHGTRSDDSSLVIEVNTSESFEDESLLDLTAFGRIPIDQSIRLQESRENAKSLSPTSEVLPTPSAVTIDKTDALLLILFDTLILWRVHTAVDAEKFR